MTPRDFEGVLEEEFKQLTGGPLPEDTRARLRQLIRELHARHPETYLAHGVQNAVRRAFETGIERLDWSRDAVERRGCRAIHRFLRRERVRDLLGDIQLSPKAVNASRCVRHAIDRLGARSGPLPRRPPPTAAEGATAAPPAPVSPAAPPEIVEPEVLAAAAAGIDARVVTERTREQEAVCLELTEHERTHLSESLSVYAADGAIDAQQAEQYGALLQVDARERDREIDAAAAESERDLILTVEKRRELEAAVARAVETTVGYVQVFESLKKISQTYDGLLKLLVEHKTLVTADDTADRTPLLGVLSESASLLDLAVGMMERADPEVRLLAVRLPPYSKLLPPGQQRPIANVTVEAEFIDDLRTCSAEDLSARFRDPDPGARARPAADILSLIHLIDQVIEPTPFRYKLRMLLANRVLQELQPRLQELYAEHARVDARSKAERVLRQRLERRFADASTEEEQAVKKRGQALLLGLEQKLDEAEQGGGDQVEEALAADDDGRDDGTGEGLTEEERQRGVQLARVEVRVAGRLKKIPTKVMPDPDDEARHVMAQRDPETGVLAPQMRRGKKRYVERATDGTWKAA